MREIVEMPKNDFGCMNRGSIKNIEASIASVTLEVQAAHSDTPFSFTILLHELLRALKNWVHVYICSGTGKERIIRWMQAPDPFSNHMNARKKCDPKSGTWFLKDLSYNAWKGTSGGLFWLYGIRKFCSRLFILGIHNPFPQISYAYNEDSY
jgi:hypothetical protein